MSALSGLPFKERCAYRFGSWGSFVRNEIFRGLQLAGGLTVFGMYFSLIRQETHPFGADTTFPEWVAVVAGASSILFSCIFALPFINPVYFPVDLVIWLLYAIVFGIYGRMFINAPDLSITPRIQTYVYAMWIDCAMAGLWILTALFGFLKWHKDRKALKAMEAQC